MEREKIEKMIVEFLKEKREATSTEIIERILSRGGETGYEDIRLTLAEMVREGVVARRPNYESKKFIFYLSGESEPRSLQS